MISLIIFATAFTQIFHIYPKDDKRTCSRSVRFYIRALCAATVLCKLLFVILLLLFYFFVLFVLFLFFFSSLGFTFIPETSLATPYWILVIGLTLIPFTFAEWVGRNKVSGRKEEKKERKLIFFKGKRSRDAHNHHHHHHDDDDYKGGSDKETKRQSVPLLDHHDEY